MRVSQAYSADDKALSPTKSGAGNRLIPIAPKLAGRLSERKSVQARELAKLDIIQGEDTPVVCSAVGGFMHPENFGRWWGGYREREGIGPYGLHQLRHTYATVLARNNTDIKTLQTLLGDSTGAIALNVYMHYNPQNGVAAMQGASDFMHGQTSALSVVSGEGGRELAKAANS